MAWKWHTTLLWSRINKRKALLIFLESKFFHEKINIPSIPFCTKIVKEGVWKTDKHFNLLTKKKVYLSMYIIIQSNLCIHFNPAKIKHYKKTLILFLFSVFQIIIITVLLVRYHWSYVTPFWKFHSIKSVSGAVVVVIVL